MLFYLGNPPWKPGDGGETGLYASGTDPVHAPAVAVPPRNNSLLAFACTPFSYHSFLSNRRTVRRTVSVVLHQRRADVVARWGAGAIIPWGTGA
jgi:Rps23 Pro-64 3,4-dihydroxylase Tpa1-like proline 4-hydroxylase